MTKRRLFILLFIGSFAANISGQIGINGWCERNREFNRVRLYLAESKSDEANSVLKVIEQKQSQNRSDTALCIYNVFKSMYYYQKGNYEQAVNYLLNAKTIWEDKFNVLDIKYLELIKMLSDCEKEMGNTDAAINYLQETVERKDVLFEEFEIYGRLLGELAELYIDKKQFSGVEDLLIKADAIMNEYYKKGSYKSYQYRVTLYFLLMETGKYDKSIQIIDEIMPVIALMDNELNNMSYSNALYGKGVNYYMLEQYDKAEPYFKENIHFCVEKLGKYNKLLESGYLGLFKLLCKTNKEEEIDALLPVIQDYYKQNPNDSTYYHTIGNGADNLMDVENYNKAIELYKLQLPIAERIAGKNSDIYYVACNQLSVSLHNKGKLLLDRKEYKEAVDMLTESLELQQKLGITYPQTSLYLEEARGHLK